MALNKKLYHQLQQELSPKGVTLVAVSKLKSVEEILEMYNEGQRDFGENYVQELVDKQSKLPADIRWHFIGHLQTNKVKFIAPIVHLIHSVDSLKLLKEINKQANKCGRIINCLLQIHVAKEETKFGLNENELSELLIQVRESASNYQSVFIQGLMGMGSFSDNEQEVRSEFKLLKTMFDQFKTYEMPNCRFSTLSMGMSGDYKWGIEEGSNMVRIGSLLFGARS